MKQYIKTSRGLVQSQKSQIKTYSTLSCLQADIDSGYLSEGDEWQLDQNVGVTEDITSDVAWLKSVTPTCASCENMLTTQADLSSVGGDVTDLEARVCSNEGGIANNTSCIACNTSLINQIGSRVQVNENNIASLQSSKVDCSDYNTCVECMACDIADLEDTRMCVSTFNSFYNNEYAVLVGSHNTLSGTVDCKVYCCDYNTCVSCLGNGIATVSGCLSSTNASLASVACRVTCLEGCCGLNYTGTVKAICSTMNGCCYLPSADGTVSVPFPVMSLSGTALTITY